MIINLKNIYQKIEENMTILHETAEDNDVINSLDKQIHLLYKYFGIHKLKVDVPPFKKDEIVQLDSDLSGDYLISLDRNDKRYVDVFQAQIEAPIYKWFYE